MNKKIAQYSALAVAVAAVLPIACKKDKTPTNSTDDPNITVRNLNLTVSDVDPSKRLSGPAATQSFRDIDNNGVNDFSAIVYYYKYDTNNIDLYSAIIDESSDTSNKVTSYFVSGDIPMVRAKTTSQIMESTTPAYYVGYTALYAKYNGDVTYNFQNEFKGKGDKYVGVKFKIGSQFHYGWMKINLSTDGKSLNIIDVAYDNRANTPITIGAR